MGLRETLSFSSVNPPVTSKCKVKAWISSVQFPLQVAEVNREEQRAGFGHSRLRGEEKFKLPACFIQFTILHSSLIVPDLHSTLRNTLCRLAAGPCSGDPAEQQARVCSCQNFLLWHPEIATSFPGFCLSGLPSWVIISPS